MTELEELLEQIKILNEHLADFKKMIAPLLGYRVKEEPCKKR